MCAVECCRTYNYSTFSFVFIPLPSSPLAPSLLGGSLDIDLHNPHACNSKSEATVVTVIEWPIVVLEKSDPPVICVAVAALQSNISQHPM